MEDSLTYAKKAKELCTPKRASRVEKLYIYANAMLLNKMSQNLKDLDVPLISSNTGRFLLKMNF